MLARFVLFTLLAVLICFNTGPGANSAASGELIRVGEYEQTAASDQDIVLFNTNSHKYHIPSCNAAKRCTHCVEMTRKKAKECGGEPCKLCGAGE